MDGIDFGHLQEMLATKLLHIGSLLLLAVAVFVGVTLGGLAAARVLRGVAHRQPAHAPLLLILARAAWVAGLVLASLTAAENLGINVTAFVASLGLAGITLGFALRDIVSSFVAGLLILAYRPFSPGDRILVQGVEGRVESIDLRYTILAAEDRTHLVPNSIILTNPVSVIAAPRPGQGPPASR